MGRFLLASDDARTRIGIAGALERAGHQVDQVTHPRLAAKSADLSNVDAVVVGLEQSIARDRFVEQIHSRSPNIPVVVLLDARSDWQESRLQALGVTIVMARPLNVAQLVTSLAKLIRTRRAADHRSAANVVAGFQPKRCSVRATSVAL